MAEVLEHGAGGAGIVARRVGTAVPQGILDDIDAATGLEHVSGRAVAQTVERVVAGDGGQIAGTIEGLPQGVLLDGVFGGPAIEQPRLGQVFFQ